MERMKTEYEWLHFVLLYEKDENEWKNGDRNSREHSQEKEYDTQILKMDKNNEKTRKQTNERNSCNKTLKLLKWNSSVGTHTAHSGAATGDEKTNEQHCERKKMCWL